MRATEQNRKEDDTLYHRTHEQQFCQNQAMQRNDRRNKAKQKTNELKRHSQHQQYKTRLRNIKIKRAHVDQMPSGRLEQTEKRKEVGKNKQTGERIGCREPYPDQAGWGGNSQSIPIGG